MNNILDTEIPNANSLRVTVDQYNAATYGKQLVHEQLNTAANWKIITDAFEEGRARDIADEKKAPLINGEKTPYIVLGSGPSLNHSIKFLRNWKGGIIATTSHALSLIHYGIQPTHIVVLDPFCTWDEIKGVDWSKTRTKLICHPGIYPDMIQNWPNEMLLYIQNSGKNSSFYHDIQKKMYTKREDQGKGIRNPIFRYYIKTELSIFACSPPLQLFAGDMVGYGRAFLCGCDFGFPGNKERFDEWILNPETRDIANFRYPNGLDPNCKDNDPQWEKYWKQNNHPDYKDTDTAMMSSNGIKSERVHLYYKKNFISAWRLSNKEIYTTDKGAITEIPYTSIEKMVKKQGLNYPKQSENMIIKATDEYLSKVDCYVIEGDNKGKLFLESVNPIEEVSNFIDNLNRRWLCPKCKNSMSSSDDVDYSESNCLKCGNKGLIKEGAVNKEKNLNRIKALVDKKNTKEKGNGII